MKSSQINYFMHPDDQREFEIFLSSIGDLCFLPTKHSSTLKVETDPKGLSEQGGHHWIVLGSEIDQVTLSYVKSTGYYLVDDSNSPVIEWWHPKFEAHQIRRGRLYFQKEYLEGDQFYPKSPEMCRLGQKLIRWIRKHYYRDEETTLGFYAGPHAMAWKKETNGIFKQF